MAPDPRPDWVLAQRQEIGHRIALRRAARGWSVDDLAGMAGLPRLAVVRVENAMVSTGLDILLQLAGAFGLTVGQMLDDGPANDQRAAT